jgi:hypothetical protein
MKENAKNEACVARMEAVRKACRTFVGGPKGKRTGIPWHRLQDNKLLQLILSRIRGCVVDHLHKDLEKWRAVLNIMRLQFNVKPRLAVPLHQSAP